MQLFILSLNMERNAAYHADTHLNSGIKETCHLLSNALRLNGLEYGYKISHKNHPLTHWCMASLSNWKWARSYAEALQAEKWIRNPFCKLHASLDVILDLPLPPIPDKGLLPFCQAIGDYITPGNPVQGYRAYYMNEKKHLFKWTNRPRPYWVKG